MFQEIIVAVASGSTVASGLTSEHWWANSTLRFRAYVVEFWPHMFGGTSSERHKLFSRLCPLIRILVESLPMLQRFAHDDGGYCFGSGPTACDKCVCVFVLVYVFSIKTNPNSRVASGCVRALVLRSFCSRLLVFCACPAAPEFLLKYFVFALRGWCVCKNVAFEVRDGADSCKQHSIWDRKATPLGKYPLYDFGLLARPSQARTRPHRKAHRLGNIHFMICLCVKNQQKTRIIKWNCLLEENQFIFF